MNGIMKSDMAKNMRLEEAGTNGCCYISDPSSKGEQSCLDLDNCQWLFLLFFKIIQSNLSMRPCSLADHSGSNSDRSIGALFKNITYIRFLKNVVLCCLDPFYGV